MAEDAAFHSMLFADDADLGRLDSAVEPEYFPHLNLDQLIGRVSRKHPRGGLEPYFWTALTDHEAVLYRQEAVAECGDAAVQSALRDFVAGLERVRQQLSLMHQVRFRLQRPRCLLDAALAYCETTRRLDADLGQLDLKSRALRGLRGYVGDHVRSRDFRRLEADARTAQQAAASVTYLLHIRSNRIRVERYVEQPDLGRDVAELFARFREHGSPGDLVVYRGSNGFGHVDAAVLEHVAQLFPDQFAVLAAFAEQHSHLVDEVIDRCAREAEFVLAVLELKAELEQRGLPMCFPTVTQAGPFVAEDCYDVVLATQQKGTSIVTNSLRLDEDERVIIVTGPNQGGKTTLARTFGQLNHLAAIGCPLAASIATISMPDGIFTLFEGQEDPGSGRGKLQDDLLRMRAIIDSANAASVIVLNEVFTSTSSEDALRLSLRLLDVILARRCRSVFVTFLDELASIDDRIVSMVAEVDPHDPSRRTFHLARRPADGRAYAEAIARKYHLARSEIRERVLR